MSIDNIMAKLKKIKITYKTLHRKIKGQATWIPLKSRWWTHVPRKDRHINLDIFCLTVIHMEKKHRLACVVIIKSLLHVIVDRWDFISMAIVIAPI